MRSHREPFYFFYFLRRRATGRSQINDRDKETYEKHGDPCDICLSPLIQWLHPTPADAKTLTGAPTFPFARRKVQGRRKWKDVQYTVTPALISIQ